MEEHTITVPQLTAAIREYIGTPFHHNGRIKGVGVDCSGLAVCAYRDLGIEIADIIHYPKVVNLPLLEETMLKSHVKKQELDFESGDWILISGNGIGHHLLYYTGEERTFIHAWYTTGARRVVESTIPPNWLPLIQSVWRFKWLR